MSNMPIDRTNAERQRRYIAKLKSNAKIASKDSDQFMLRFLPGMREQFRKLAWTNGRSMNTEIIAAVEERLKRGDRLKQIEMRLANLEYYVKPTQHLEPRNHEP